MMCSIAALQQNDDAAHGTFFGSVGSSPGDNFMAHPTQAQFFGVQQANLDLFLALVGPLARGAEKISGMSPAIY